MGVHHDEPSERNAVRRRDSDIARRYVEHREGAGARFISRYALTRLVYAERHEDMLAAIQREKNFKHWLRAWKTRLIAE
jgi:putative endonuclease